MSAVDVVAGRQPSRLTVILRTIHTKVLCKENSPVLRLSLTLCLLDARIVLSLPSQSPLFLVDESHKHRSEDHLAGAARRAGNGREIWFSSR